MEKKWKYIQGQSRELRQLSSNQPSLCAQLSRPPHPLFILRSLLAYNATCTITKDTKREAI